MSTVVSAVEISQLQFSYPDKTQALRGVNFSVPCGSRVAILGPNGAGKSTLLLHLNGIHVAQEGRVSILGEDVTSSNLKWVRSKVGVVFQDPDDQVFSLTVREDVAFGPLNLDLGRDEVAARVEDALATVGLAGLSEKNPQNLSFGQKKRVALAGVLAMGTEILVLDEPLAHLDPTGQRDLVSTLDQLSTAGKTIIVASHNIDFVAEWADRVIIIAAGRIIADGDKRVLLDRDLMEKQAGLTRPTVTRLFEGYLEQPPTTLEEARHLLKYKFC